MPEEREDNLAVEEVLTPKQELFCVLYASDREFFGNGVQSYLEAFDPPRKNPNWYDIACVDASRLLSNAKIYSKINVLLENCGFNDVAVDKQLSALIAQHADKPTKLGAIKEYNKLKARIKEKEEKNQPVKIVITHYGNKEDTAEISQEQPLTL